VDGAGRTSQVVDLVNLNTDRKGHLVPDQLDVVTAQQVRDVSLGSIVENIEAELVSTTCDQAIVQRAAGKTLPAGNEDSPPS
jgi:hypothetical protein